MKKLKNEKRIGEILLILEPILDLMVLQGLQTGDILALVHLHLQVHQPGAFEEYEDGSRPEFYYGPGGVR
jgi:hypothetical protein